MLRWIFLSLGLLAVPIEGQRDFDLEYVEGIEPLSYVAYRTAGELQIDGKLDEPSWQRAAWTAPFVDIEGPRKPLPRLMTRAKMLWDQNYNVPRVLARELIGLFSESCMPTCPPCPHAHMAACPHGLRVCRQPCWQGAGSGRTLEGFSVCCARTPLPP